MISSKNYPKSPGQEKYETWDMRDSESNQDTLRLLHNIINPTGEISEDNTFTPYDPATLLGAGGILDLLGRKAGKSAKLVKKLVGPSANTNVKNIPIKNISPDSYIIPQAPLSKPKKPGYRLPIERKEGVRICVRTGLLLYPGINQLKICKIKVLYGHKIKCLVKTLKSI